MPDRLAGEDARRSPAPHPSAAPAARAPLRRPPAGRADPLPIPTVADIAGPPPYAAKARVVPPGSKSLTNRVLLLAALADGPSVIERPLLDADDAQRMIAALRRLGVAIEHNEPTGELVVHGRSGTLAPPDPDEPLFLNNAGTATRFLTAAAVLADGPVTIDGNARMRERPIGELVAMLGRLGAHVEPLGEPGFVPLRVHPTRSLAGEITVGTTQSSQFVSALCMIAPWFDDGLNLRFAGEITSRSYVEMTLGLMRETVGVDAQWLDHGRTLRIPHMPYPGFEYAVEPDASGATYPWAAAALLPGVTVRVPGLAFTSLQSDARFLLPLRSMGCAIEYAAGAADCTGPAHLAGLESTDFAATPDAAMTLAAVAAFADTPTRITGLRTLRVKETDRLAATHAELARVGVRVETTEDAMTIHPTPDAPHARDGVVFRTYDDHRMAMSLSLVALRTPNCSIADPGCVAKTYPSFFAHLASIIDAVAARRSRF